MHTFALIIPVYVKNAIFYAAALMFVSLHFDVTILIGLLVHSCVENIPFIGLLYIHALEKMQ